MPKRRCERERVDAVRAEELHVQDMRTEATSGIAHLRHAWGSRPRNRSAAPAMRPGAASAGPHGHPLDLADAERLAAVDRPDLDVDAVASQRPGDLTHMLLDPADVRAYDELTSATRRRAAGAAGSPASGILRVKRQPRRPGRRRPRASSTATRVGVVGGESRRCSFLDDARLVPAALAFFSAFDGV